MYLEDHYLRLCNKYIQSRDFASAKSLLSVWMQEFFASCDALTALPPPKVLQNPSLWWCLSRYASLSGDSAPVNSFLDWLESVPIEPPVSSDVRAWPVIGIPILNRPDLLQRLLESIDVPVGNLAIVDNGSKAGLPGSDQLKSFLFELESGGWPGIESICVARPFANQGVAASWNHILTSFVKAPLVLLANNDVIFAPGVLAEALAALDPRRPQFMPLLPAPQEFSAFALTALAWDRVGLFDENFYPAYCEDLDYAERLKACPEVEWLIPHDLQERMQALNHEHSATIRSDAVLEGYNRSSYPLNCLWLFSDRRLRGERRGIWRRRWLAQWSSD
ncbi:glycosyltransferase family 2 protein [Synechococcus sp. CBW1006]|uniref:glycosyltransferase family 2 protein n=1 Tax=Synechococcus sp. CBW1006 TaxID=1353138 RepID=UPI0018CE3FB2|nr:hypothetical protein [Synechococcus sp. CBW1006]QPN65814.1 hypothetical protein H8F26_13050 [Synechococcus sp. CBW1006]